LKVPETPTHGLIHFGSEKTYKESARIARRMMSAARVEVRILVYEVLARMLDSTPVMAEPFS
jgi:hypothetical protein